MGPTEWGDDVSIGGRKRRRDARKDTPYMRDLPEAEREYMEIFLDAEYGNQYDAQVALAGDVTQAKAWQSDVNAAAYSARTDAAFNMKQIGFKALAALDDGAELDLGPPGPAAKPSIRAPKYSVADYMPAPPASPEDTFAAFLEGTAEDNQFQPYGDSPEGLAPGHRVVICLPAHYLKGRTGVVRAYRQWTGDYLIEADRPARRGKDGPGATTTWAWVSLAGLRRRKPSLAT